MRRHSGRSVSSRRSHEKPHSDRRPLGCTLAQASDAQVQALETYGRQVGVAFQIVDDVLDLTGDEEMVGKTLGLDLSKGKLTLPVLHSLQASGDAEREEMYRHLEQALVTIGFLSRDTREVMMRRFRRILGRAEVSREEVKKFRGVARQTLWVAREAGLSIPEEYVPDGPVRPTEKDPS